MTATREQLSALRQSLAEIVKAERRPPRARHPTDRFVTLDEGVIDAAVGGGLERAALHEIVAERQADAVAARGFAAAMALRAAGGGRSRPIVWMEQDQTLHEIGHLSADGLNALGLDPSAVLLVKARDAVSALRAAVEAAKCPAVGAVVSEIWGAPKTLDLNATRRLMLAAQHSGVMVVLARLGVPPQPSAAETRWSVRMLSSVAFPANAPGRPAFSLDLLRHRHGTPAGPWHVEWNADDRLIHVQDIRNGASGGRDTALPGDRAAASGDRPAAPFAKRRLLRLAG